MVDTQLNVSSSISKLIESATFTVLVKVTVGVLLGVGVIGVVNPLKLKTTDLPEQLFDVDGVGVNPKFDKSKLTSSHATLGVGVGSGSQSQSK